MDLAVVAAHKSAVSTGDVIAIIAVMVIAIIFLVLWKKAELKPLVAGIIVLLPVITGVLIGSFPAVAKQLYHLTGGKIGFP